MPPDRERHSRDQVEAHLSAIKSTKSARRSLHIALEFRALFTTFLVSIERYLAYFAATRHILCIATKTGFSLNRPSTTSFRILLIDENPIRIAILEEGLREAGQTDITVIDDMTGLVNKIYALDPDVVIIDLENPSRDVLEQMFQVSRVVKRPIAMFVDRSDSRSIAASVEAGVSAYIVDGLKKERVMPILEMAVSRFNAFEKLQAELEETRSALEDRARRPSSLLLS